MKRPRMRRSWLRFKTIVAAINIFAIVTGVAVIAVVVVVVGVVGRIVVVVVVVVVGNIVNHHIVIPACCSRMRLLLYLLLLLQCRSRYGHAGNIVINLISWVGCVARGGRVCQNTAIVEIRSIDYALIVVVVVAAAVVVVVVAALSAAAALIGEVMPCRCYGRELAAMYISVDELPKTLPRIYKSIYKLDFV